MQVITYSDASYRNSKGTWAGCVTLDNVLVVEYEEKIEKCHSVDYAELYGIYRLLETTPSLWSNSLNLLMLTDSMSVVKWLTTRKEPRNLTTRSLYKRTVQIIDELSHPVEINHISRNSPNYYFRNCHSRAKTINT